MAKIKVSQSTIDQIKKMGMDKALKSASGASDEMKEGLRRMYGERRLAAAGGSIKATAKNTAPSAISGKMKSSATSSKPKSSAPSAISGKKVLTTSSKKVATKKATKANGLPGVKRGGSSSMKFGINFDKIQARFGANSPADNAARANKTSAPKSDKYATVAAINAKRMGITVAEYNRRLNAKKK